MIARIIIAAALGCAVIASGRAAAAPAGQSTRTVEQARDNERPPSESTRPRFVATPEPTPPSRSYALTWTPTWSLEVYLGGGVFNLKPSDRARALGQPIALTSGTIATFLRYAFVDLSTQLLMFDKDPVSFGETACSLGDRGDCQSWSSSTMSVTLSAKAGAHYRWSWTFDRSALVLSLWLGLGGTTLSVNRSVDYVGARCDDCRTEHVLSASGMYVSPGLVLAYAYGTSENAGLTFGIRTSYDQYLVGGIDRAFWVSLSVGVSAR
jgi:hypothetical protein